MILQYTVMSTLSHLSLSQRNIFTVFTIFSFCILSETSPDNSATTGAIVGGVVGAIVAVVAVIAVIILTVYCFIGAKRKYVDLHTMMLCTQIRYIYIYTSVVM